MFTGAHFTPYWNVQCPTQHSADDTEMENVNVPADPAHMTHGIQVGCVLPHSGNLRCNPCRKSVIICSIWSCHHLSPFCVLIMECTISGPFKRFHCPVTRSLV
ncbi:uncharacterized protein LOC124114572 isoform X1 [Haliotis rufescens]|uniref:uncharacterized protein LOC125375984 isoform X1 n=1 Tax=Haliotis rufescens TaxID=6454 RepID=UPI00201F1724|nr:uncharacterized protein LOC125375984 isoform X1 [Haliotis rufescens]XP_048256457.1 uncharacterized protein LOC124114572 isoform X1 [Haliotis rufescens]